MKNKMLRSAPSTVICAKQFHHCNTVCACKINKFAVASLCAGYRPEDESCVLFFRKSFLGCSLQTILKSGSLALSCTWKSSFIQLLHARINRTVKQVSCMLQCQWRHFLETLISSPLILFPLRQLKRTKEVWAQLLTADKEQCVIQMLAVQLTQKTRIDTFVVVTMAL